MIIKQLASRTWFSAIVTSLMLSTPMAHAQLETLDRISVIVDDDIIMQSELDSRVAVVKNQSKGMRLPPDEILEQQVQERLIIESIQLQMAERSGIRISDQQLNQIIDTIAKQNGMSIRQFQQALAKDGVGYAEARDQIRRERIISEVQRYRVGSTIQISEQDIDSFLNSARGQTATSEEYRIGHILIQVPSQAKKNRFDKSQEKSRRFSEILT